MMELARREFLKESMATLGFLALPGGLFAVPTGWKPKGKKPNLVLGVMSDSHLRVGYDAVTPAARSPISTCRSSSAHSGATPYAA